MMATLLADNGYGVMTVGTVAEALALAQESEFDLFLLDIRLPDGTGIELCQKLRAIRPSVPVLYYSAYGYDAAHQAALATCGDAYLRKPVSIEEVESAIVRLLRNRA